MSQFGKINVELWDVSGDFKFEKCWAPIQTDVQGIIFVYDPANPDSEDDLKRFVEMFPKALKIKQSFCLCYINNHNSDGSNNAVTPQCMNNLEKFQGSAEDNQAIIPVFDKYLTKLIKQLIEK